MKNIRTVARLFALFLSLATSVAALADKTVSGQVTAAGDGAGIAGIVVTVIGSDQSTTTDHDGNYTLRVPDGATLRFIVNDIPAEEVRVGDQTEINIRLGG